MNFGFIITRHVNDIMTSNYWKECIKQIRKFYKDNYIIIIDDDSNKMYLDNEGVEDLIKHNIIIVESEYKRRGELLPYYHFLRQNLFENAVIIHDSLFFNNYFDFDNATINTCFFNFDHVKDNVEEDKRLISYLNNSEELIDYYDNKNMWFGFFGAMMYINYYFLEKLVKKYNLFVLLDHINTRDLRMRWERIIGLLVTIENKRIYESLFGNINNYPNCLIYGPRDYFKDRMMGRFNHYHITKLWSGR